MFFLLCPPIPQFLCAPPSAATFCYVQEYPLPPVTPDLKPKREGQGD